MRACQPKGKSVRPFTLPFYSFSFETTKGTAGCRAFCHNYIVGEEKSSYFKELALNLQHEGYTVGQLEDGLLPVESEGRRLCRAVEGGGVRYRQEDVASDSRGVALEWVTDIAKATAEYMGQMEAVPFLTASGLTGDYRLLAEFNNTVLAGHPTEYGVQFVTCERVQNRTALDQGHYYGPNAGIDGYTAAKENIDTGKMTSEQIAQIYGAFSQMESTNHSSNMRVSVRMRMEKGLFVPPSTPYGYRLAGRELEIIPEEAEVVRYIYTAYLKGQGVTDIAQELNELGAVRRHGRDRWHPHTIQYILTNVSYTGDMLWQKCFHTDTIPSRYRTGDRSPGTSWRTAIRPSPPERTSSGCRS